MNSAVCTLFEGDYHYGLAGLTNSLFSKGFRGSIYAGYRGEIPSWANDAKPNISLKWANARTFNVAEGVDIHFLPIITNNHFSNYKPDFMLDLWNGPASNAKNMFYFDPDIVIIQSWLVFEEWVTCGIALCEDVNSPLSELHPRRVAWRRYFFGKNISLKFKDSIYVNSGFIGLVKEKSYFLEHWRKIQEILAPLLGGLNHSIFKSEHLALLEQVGGPFMPFVKTDQDALNIAIEEMENCEISFMGKEGMGFGSGFVLMHHALGVPKPWNWLPYIQVIDGRPPRRVDIEFWNVISGPAQPFSAIVTGLRKFNMKVAAGIGRFYKRN